MKKSQLLREQRVKITYSIYVQVTQNLNIGDELVIHLIQKYLIMQSLL